MNGDGADVRACAPAELKLQNPSAAVMDCEAEILDRLESLAERAHQNVSLEQRGAIGRRVRNHFKHDKPGLNRPDDHAQAVIRLSLPAQELHH